MRQITHQQALSLAERLGGEGRLAEAYGLLRRLTAEQPLFAEAWLSLGNASRRLGAAPRAAAAAWRLAAACLPQLAGAYAGLSVSEQERGLTAQAIRQATRALRLGGNASALLINCGLMKAAQGRRAAARADFAAAACIDPALAETWFGVSEYAEPASPAAQRIEWMKRAVRCRGDFHQAWVNLATLLQRANDGGALGCVERAAALAPADPDAWLNLAAIRQMRGLPAAGIFRRPLRLRPDHGEAATNYATALQGEGRMDEAGAVYAKALACRPDHAAGWYNVGCVALDRYERAAAVRCFARAARLDPQHDKAMTNLGMTLLQLGDYERGWPAYEARLRDPETYPRRFLRPQWRGEDLAGRTILVHAEQGFGDTIQFIRYAPLLAARGGRVLLEAQEGLLRLLARAPGVSGLIPRGAPLPDHDYQSAVVSLPGYFSTRLDTVPFADGYLSPDPHAAAAWRRRLPVDGVKIGFIWAGSATFKKDAKRSPRLAAMRPILDVADARFFILQKGDGRRDLADAALPENVVDLGDDISDFADTAAIISNLDLVVSSCTGPAHLAAALGTPTWIIVPQDADWRWLLDRDDSPWYRSVRLFRQKEAGRWSETVDDVKRALQDRIRCMS